jgi:predicted O-linked N-acetylglucosamine transferase (SPINDLY family)
VFITALPSPSPPPPPPAVVASPLPPGDATSAGFRVGFISSDFKRHPVSILLSPALAAMRRVCPRLHTHLFALSDDEPADEWRRGLRAAAHSFVSLHGVPDEEAARQLHAADLHLLVDLNGLYSRGARPALLAARAAPLQATHLGYGASCGARFVELQIADRLALPAERAHSRWCAARS